MTTFYNNNSWNCTKNNALFYLYLNDSIMFKIDEQTYGCEFYNYDASFKNRKQVEALFDTSIDMISPYNIVELCETMKGTIYENKDMPNDSNSGTYKFEKLNLDSSTLRRMMDGDIAYYAA
jgi:hypothetical protein